MRIFDWLDKRKKVYTHLDEDTIKSNEIIKAQQQTIQSQQSQLSKIFAKEKEKRDKEQEKDKESDRNKKLHEQKADLDAHRHGKIVKLGKFYKILLTNKKYRDSLEICDKDDAVVLAKFGDFGIMEGGKLCMLDSKGEIMAFGKTLNHILFKPDSFENMFRRKRFLIPSDKDGNWMEDLEYKEIPEPLDAVFDEHTGQIKRITWSKVRTSEVKKIISDKLEQIHNLSDSLDMSEGVVIGLKKEIDDLKRALSIADSQADISQSALSRNLFKFTETEKRLGEMHMNITKLTELKATYESVIEQKDNIINNLIKKIDQLSEPKYEWIKASLKDDLEFYKAILPDRVEIKQEAPPEPKIVTQPGNIIK